MYICPWEKAGLAVSTLLRTVAPPGLKALQQGLNVLVQLLYISSGFAFYVTSLIRLGKIVSLLLVMFFFSFEDFIVLRKQF